MKPMQTFWGLLIIIVGVIFLGINMGWWSGILWDQIWQLWPLILIVVGLRSLIKSDSLYIISLIVTLAIGLLLVGLTYGKTETVRNEWSFSRIWGDFSNDEKASLVKAIDVDADDQLAIDLSGNYRIEIQGGTGTQVTVNLNGPKEIIDRVQFVKEGNGVRLAEESGGTRGLSWFSAQLDGVTGIVTMPSTMASTYDLSGLVDISTNNYQGKLSVDASGAVDVNLEDSVITDPSAELSGTGKISFGTIQGNANFDLSGAGKISAKSATLTRLDIDLSGAGEVNIDQGTITDASIKASGASKVSIPKPTGQIQQENSGASKIELR